MAYNYVPGQNNYLTVRERKALTTAFVLVRYKPETLLNVSTFTLNNLIATYTEWHKTNRLLNLRPM